jgi:hypothetical protein
LVWTGVAHGNGKSIDLISPQHLVQVQKVCARSVQALYADFNLDAVCRRHRLPCDPLLQ